MTESVHVFVALVDRQRDGMRSHFIPIPDDVADDLLALGTRRVIATINGVECKRAIQGSMSGERRLIVGIPLLRDARADVGHPVEVALRTDPNPEDVDLAEEFVAVLEEDPEAAERFYALTPGMQRSLAYYVNSGKRVETRIKRSLEMAKKLRTRGLHSDRNI